MGNFTIQQHGAKGKILIMRLSGEVNSSNSIRISELWFANVSRETANSNLFQLNASLTMITFKRGKRRTYLAPKSGSWIPSLGFIWVDNGTQLDIRWAAGSKSSARVSGWVKEV